MGDLPTAASKGLSEYMQLIPQKMVFFSVIINPWSSLDARNHSLFVACQKIMEHFVLSILVVRDHTSEMLVSY